MSKYAMKFHKVPSSCIFEGSFDNSLLREFTKLRLLQQKRTQFLLKKVDILISKKQVLQISYAPVHGLSNTLFNFYYQFSHLRN